MKAILVIDMPKHCIECPICSLNEMTGLYNCMDGTKNEKCVDDYLIGNYDNKPQWCPLKPMPKKKSKDEDYVERVGYNKCIDEILGGEE